jgi:aryl-alcohol dehydrogenase-like predicted oxidoreductase
MTTGTVPYLDKPVSRIVCGTDFLMGAAPGQSFQALDAYWAAGGRTFDTAFCYGANTNVFAAWTGSRGVRDEVIYFDKGCHPAGSRPKVTYEDMKSDILKNHENLGREYTDFFVLHRDNPEVPVGEIVDWLNEFKDAGLIGVFGGSNWHHTRIAAANEYAAAHGKQPFSLNNPNLTLAENVVPLWGGCLTIDEEGRKWHAETGLPLFAWSSTARGYFAGVDDPEVLRAYDSETNRARRDRATALGEKYGMSTVQIALAWTLSQPGNIFALCGLRTVDNVKQNVAVLELQLSPEELRYLEFGEG